jgi:hypothetical protein
MMGVFRVTNGGISWDARALSLGEWRQAVRENHRQLQKHGKELEDFDAYKKLTDREKIRLVLQDIMGTLFCE